MKAASSAHLETASGSAGRSAGQWGMVLAAVLLAGAISLVLYGEHRPVTRRFQGHVADLLPSAAALPGWTVEDRPVADTPEMQKRVGEILNFDDAVYRIYVRAGDRFSVYVAYWTPGKMSHRLVATHTPDVCWVGGGWKIETAASGVKLGGMETLPAEKRAMIIHDTKEYVVFWHRVGQEAVSYGTRGIPPWYSPLLDICQRGLRQRQEQFFVRVSSNRPVEEWPRFEVYQMLLDRLPIRRGSLGGRVDR